MTAAENARESVQKLTRDQLQAALMCVWVRDPTTFWAALTSATAAAS